MTLRTFTTDTAPELRKEIPTQFIKPTWEEMQHGWPQPQVDQEDLAHFCKSFLCAGSVHLRLFSAPVQLWKLWWRKSQNSWEPEIDAINNYLWQNLFTVFWGEFGRSGSSIASIPEEMRIQASIRLPSIVVKLNTDDKIVYNLLPKWGLLQIL